VRSALALTVVVGCSFQPGLAPSDDAAALDDAPDRDADIDAPSDTSDPGCFGKNPFTICLATQPTSDVTLPMAIDTGDTGTDSCTSIGGTIAQVGSVEVCAIAGTHITAAGTIVGVFGPRPLVLVATESIDVTTTSFDLTSRTAGTSSDGPNANPPQCTTDATQNGASSMGAASGGAGGTFGTKGSDGGGAASGNVAGGVAKAPPTTFDLLRGGCPGGAGAAGTANSATVAGGSGGGVVYLVARNAITISGTINASGGGGRGGDGSRGGGSGGGSGGMIVLHAPLLSLSAGARVFANGGGGGGGAGQTFTDGSNGADPISADTAALGGIASGPDGTNGGAGAFKATPAGTVTAAAQGGAGGGGGGAGVIRILSGQSVAPINVSPTPIVD